MDILIRFFLQAYIQFCVVLMFALALEYFNYNFYTNL